MASEYIFPGSDTVGVPTSINVVAWDTGSSLWSCRVWDATNLAVVAEITGQTNTSGVITNLGSINNVSATECIWEIQLLSSVDKKAVRMSALQIIF